MAAKYTKLYADYVKDGGAIPAVFADIPDFETLFLLQYCDKEIGFETEYLFALKLEAKANIIIPEYKKKIDLLNATYEEAKDPHAVSKYGTQTTKTTELPFDSETAEANLVNTLEEHTNEQYGATEEVNMARLDFFNKKVKPLIQTCLDEFDTLFMKVY